MKKLLSLLGVAAISASTGTAVFAVKTHSTIYNQQDENKINNNPFENNSSMNNLRKSYDSLSENEKTDIAIEMKKLSELDISDINKIDQYLSNSNIMFIRNNKEVIESNYLLYNSINKMAESLSISTLSLNINWSMINEFVNLNFGNSNDYTPSVSTYGPAHWWTAIWDWGWKINFPEGDVNVMRVLRLLVSLYNGINFQPLETLLKSGQTLFDYLVNLDQHDNDKISVLYDLIVKTEIDFKISRVPFTNELYEIFDEFSSQLSPWKNIEGLKVGFIKSDIQREIKNKLKMSIEEIGTKYSGYINKTVNIITIVNNVLDIIKGLPTIIVDFILGGILVISTQMINVDWNHNGVSLKFQQFLIPLGFSAR